jgi:hypothetical protein
MARVVKMATLSFFLSFLLLATKKRRPWRLWRSLMKIHTQLCTFKTDDDERLHGLLFTPPW